MAESASGPGIPTDPAPVDEAQQAPSTWQLYVLRCADGSLYTGITTDLERRLSEHRAGKGARYTRGRLPLRCEASWSYPDRSSASRAEAAFKRLRRPAKLRYLTRPDAWHSGAS